jgi:hypothetical protein
MQELFLPLVHRLDGLEQLGVETVLGRAVDQRLDVLRETRAAVARAGVDKTVADARIRADAYPHLLDVGAHAFGEVGHFVHEADLRRQHRVGSVLGQFGRAHIHDDQPIAVARERIVQRLEQLGRPRILGADDDTIRFHEVRDRGPFFQEFGVRNDIEFEFCAAGGQRLLDPVADLVAVPTGTVDLSTTMR